MSLNNRQGDRMSTFIAVLSTIIALAMLFVDWRYSVVATLVVWNQFIFKEFLEGRDVKIKYIASIIIIIGSALYLFI